MKRCKTALIIVDMINLFDFPEARTLVKFAGPVARNIKSLKNRLYRKNLPVIYVNDNFGEWISDWKAVYAKCCAHGHKGRDLAITLKPTERDYFILKPRHSGFEATPLELLLKKLKVKRLVITGVAGDICVLFTAHDAHAREFQVVVPKDCIASNTKKQNDVALQQLSKALGIETSRAASVRF